MAVSNKFSARKSLGQHFLMHARIAERIADTAKIIESGVVFEIGPGTGMLTRALLKRAERVIALEADAGFAQKLETEFAEEIKTHRFEPIFADIRTFDLEKLPSDYTVVANIPYYVTGEIIRMFLEAKNQPRSMTLLVQKEVAERIARSKKESLLSLSVKAYGTPKYMFTVPRGAFIPAPKVDSAVLSILNISRKNFPPKADPPSASTTTAEKRFFQLIHAGFAHKRKLLASNLKVAGVTLPEHLSKKRAEDLSLADWFTLIH